MNYSNRLYIFMATVLFAIVFIKAMEQRQKAVTMPTRRVMTIEERRQRSSMPLTIQQTKQGNIKAASKKRVTTKDIENFNHNSMNNHKSHDNDKKTIFNFFK